MAKFHLLTVSDIRRETADAVSIAFAVPNQLLADYQFKHGQYITLKLNVGGEELRRSYSVCTSPFIENELRVAVKEVKGGRASTYLNRELKKGDSLEVMTPMGNFTTPLSGNSEKNYLLFAGGSGITPIMSILKSILHVEKQSRVTLFYANRDEASEIFSRDLDVLRSNSRFQLIRIYDSPAKKSDELHTGIVTEDKVKFLLNFYSGNSIISDVFICGPGPMMENVKNALLQVSIPQEKIHIEYFSTVQETLAQEEASTAKEISSKITVIQYGIETSFQLNSNGATILDAALDAGVDAPYSCKGAVCCTCRAKVLEGKVKMDANFALTDGEIAQGFVLTCQSHPLTEKVIVDYDAM